MTVRFTALHDGPEPLASTDSTSLNSHPGNTLPRFPVKLLLVASLVCVVLYVVFSAGVAQGQQAVEGAASASALRHVTAAMEAARQGDLAAAGFNHGRAVGASPSLETLVASGEFFVAAKNWTVGVKLLEEAAQAEPATGPSVKPLIERKLDEYRKQAARN